MNFIFWLGLAQAKQSYITEELQMWHTYLGGTLIIATQGPEAYKVAQKSLQQDPSIPARIAPIPQMGKTDIHLSKVLRVNKAQCVLWVQPPNKKYAIETFGNCPKERKIQVIHREQFQSYLDRIEQEKIEQEKSEVQMLEAAKKDTTEVNTDDISNKEISSNEVSTEEVSTEEVSTDDTTSLEGTKTNQETDISQSSEEMEGEQPPKTDPKNQTDPNHISTTSEEEPTPELEKTFEPITMDPKWVPNQDWGVFDSNGTFIPPLTFSILAEYKPLEMTLRDELKQMNQKSRFIGLFSGGLAVGGVMKLLTSTSSNTYVNVHSAWTSIFLFSTSGLFLYAKSIPAKELKLKQFALSNYMTYEEAVLIDIQRQLQTSDGTNGSMENEKDDTGEKLEEKELKEKAEKKAEETQSKDTTSTGKKRKLTFKKDLLQSQKDSKKETQDTTEETNKENANDEEIDTNSSQSLPSTSNKTHEDTQTSNQEKKSNQEAKEQNTKEKGNNETLEQSSSDEPSKDGDKE